VVSGHHTHFVARHWRIEIIFTVAVSGLQRPGFCIPLRPRANGHGKRAAGIRPVVESQHSPNWKRRRSHTVRKAVAAKIEWELLLDIIDVLMANYNVTPTEALGNRAALSALRDHLCGSPPTFLPRPLRSLGDSRGSASTVAFTSSHKSSSR
jgi:hypothetical protein